MSKATSNAWYAVSTNVPCTRCGECCRQLPCSLGKLDKFGQCVELRSDGCALAMRDPLMAEALLIGYGCGATFIPKVYEFLKFKTKPEKTIDE